MKKGRFLGLTEQGLGLNGAMQTGFSLTVSSSPGPEGGALAADLELSRLLLGKHSSPDKKFSHPSETRVWYQGCHPDHCAQTGTHEVPPPHRGQLLRKQIFFKENTQTF